MFIKFKEGVSIEGIQPVLISGIHLVASVYESWGWGLTLTSVCDGTHSPNSKHYEGLAFDCRIWQVPEHLLPSFVNHIKHVLGSDWDVVWHPVNHKTHIHVEYDPE